jgi:hypothetical protein
VDGLNLLGPTLASLERTNTYSFGRRVLVDGSCDPEKYASIAQVFGGSFDLIFPSCNLDQAGAIDLAYSTVDTPFIFHCEDDWDFHGSGYVEQSLEILNENPQHLMVWVRDHDDSGHPRLPETYYTTKGTPYRKLTPNYKGWKGFSWSSGLRRLSDYHLIRPYSSHVYPSANPWEKAAGIIYANMGFVTVSTAGKYCKHTGADRHIEVPPTRYIVYSGASMPSYCVFTASTYRIR